MKKIFVTILTMILIATAVMYFTKSDRTVHDISIEDIEVNELGMQNDTFHYQLLDETQKRYYRIIANGIMNLDENITIEITKQRDYDLYKSNIEVALTAFLADHPEVFFVNDKYEISLIDTLVMKIIKLKLDYISNDKNEILEMEQELKRKIQDINNQARYYTSEYSKEEFIHDYIAKNVSYYNYQNYEDIPTIKHTAYGALVQGSAVCDGITKAFQLVLSEANIESIFVTGYTENVAHAWSKVKIDGDYYNVDLTSDKTLSNINNDLVIHSYFNITDEEILKTHTIDNNGSMPQCTATKYNYYLYNDYHVSYMDGLEYKLDQIVNKQKNKKILEVNIIGISDVPSKLITALYNINFNNYQKNNITKIEYHKVNNNYIIVK